MAGEKRPNTGGYTSGVETPEELATLATLWARELRGRRMVQWAFGGAVAVFALGALASIYFGAVGIAFGALATLVFAPLLIGGVSIVDAVRLERLPLINELYGRKADQAGTPRPPVETELSRKYHPTPAS